MLRAILPLLSFAWDVVSPMWMDLFLFGLAAASYWILLRLPIPIKQKQASPVSKEQSMSCNSVGPAPFNVQANQQTDGPSTQHQGAKSASAMPSLPCPTSQERIRRDVSLIKTFARHGDLQGARSTFNRVVANGSANRVAYNCFLDACVQCHDFDSALRHFCEMKALGLLDTVSYNTIVKAYVHRGGVDAARACVQEMALSGLKPDSITYHELLQAAVHSGNQQAIPTVLEEMRATGIRSNEVTRSILAKAFRVFVKTRDASKAFDLYETMCAHGITCSTIMYNILLQICVSCSTMYRAKQLIRDMKDAGAEPDIITYSTIIKGCCQQGELEKAFQIMEVVKQDTRLCLDEFTYNIVLSSCARQRRVDDALWILQELRLAKVAPSNHTLSILVKLLGHARRLHLAFRMVEDLSKEFGFHPNVQVYTCLVHACTINRKLDWALSLHNKIVSNNLCIVDQKFYDVLVRCCLQLQPLRAIDVVRAAHGLNGTLALPSGGGSTGMEIGTLETVAAQLQSAGYAEQRAWYLLSADLTLLGIPTSR